MEEIVEKITLKIAALGDFGVGKTSLVFRYVVKYDHQKIFNF